MTVHERQRHIKNPPRVYELWLIDFENEQNHHQTDNLICIAALAHT